MLHQKLIASLIFLLISIVSYALPYDFHCSIKWNGIQNVSDNSISMQRISFEGAYYHEIEGLPVFNGEN